MSIARRMQLAAGAAAVSPPAGDGNIAYGTFGGPGSTGTQDITGIGYTPGLVLLFSANLVGGTESDGSARMAFGAAVPGGAKWSMSMSTDDTSSAPASRHIFRSDYALAMMEIGGADVQDGIIDTVVGISGGFRVNWTVAETATVHYIAFPPSLDIHVGTLDTGTSTGTQDITAPGFEPDVVLFGTTLTNTTETAQAVGQWCLGAGTSATARCAVAGYNNDAGSPSVAKGLVTNSACLVRHAGAANTMVIDYNGAVTDGFQIDLATAPASSTRVGYVAIGGLSAHAGVFTAPASTGTQAYTGVGFQPTAGFWWGRGPTALDTLQGALQMNVGSATSPSNRGVIGFGAVDGTASSNISRFQSLSDAWAVTGGSSSTTDQDADLDSFDADGWTFDWTDVTGATYGCYLMFRHVPS